MSMGGLATFPVIEIFGPTVQGEGPDAGRPCYFVRFGGCDFRCEWCDSMYAVDPAEVRANAERLSVDQIAGRIGDLERGPGMVVFSGGNPALQDLGGLVDELHAVGFDISVETQGSRWKPWLNLVDRLVISPKGPSSGMTDKTAASLPGFMEASDTGEEGTRVLKIVIDGDEDLEWARGVTQEYPGVPLYLSVCTPQHLPDDRTTKIAVEDRFRDLADLVAADPLLAHAYVLPQLHVLAYGTARGV